jgi:osmotically-inducible protein OsmY
VIPDVRNGQVWLRGTVRSPYQKWRAEDLAARTAGVVGIDNRITTADRRVRREDAEIKASIQDQFFWNPFIREEEMDVIVRDGTVTLKGVVDNRLERDLAIEDAAESGADRVYDDIRIKGVD